MKNLYSLLTSILFFGLIQAQTFTNYTTLDGLVDNNINCVIVDAQDNAWFGTANGISKFDGSIWTTFNTTSHPGLVSNTIFDICAKSNGDIWVGSDDGLSKFDGAVWTTYTDANGLGDNRVKAIKEKSNGELWIGEYDGLTIFDGTNWTAYNMSDGLPFGGIVSIGFDSNGDAWLGSGLGGLVKFDGTNFTTYTEVDGLLNNIVRSVGIDANDYKWIGTAKGVSVFDANNNFLEHHTRMLILPAPDTLNPTVDVDINSFGNIWTGIYVDYLVTEGGIALYSNGQWADFDVSDGLIGPVVRDLEVDSQDDVWVATSTGASKITGYTGIAANSISDNGITIYPNPVNNILNIEADGFENSINSVNIFDVYDRLVFSKNSETNVLNIDVSGLTKGMYIVRINEGVIKKIVVN